MVGAAPDAGRVEVSGLSKSFGDVKAVDELSFTVEPGSITGFLGPNGAGKTTTLRMLLGLVSPDAGVATIGDRSYEALPAPSDEVGAVLEASGFHPARSGRDHLRVYCDVNGYPSARADEALGLVGLGTAAGRAVRGYSLGMRQRLALAGALLGDPAGRPGSQHAIRRAPAGSTRDGPRRVARASARRDRTCLRRAHGARARRRGDPVREPGDRAGPRAHPGAPCQGCDLDRLGLPTGRGARLVSAGDRPYPHHSAARAHGSHAARSPHPR